VPVRTACRRGRPHATARRHPPRRGGVLFGDISYVVRPPGKVAGFRGDHAVQATANAPHEESRPLLILSKIDHITIQLYINIQETELALNLYHIYTGIHVKCFTFDTILKKLVKYNYFLSHIIRKNHASSRINL
jgi:hypothetical protein